jgi:hypothetical protein
VFQYWIITRREHLCSPPLVGGFRVARFVYVLCFCDLFFFDNCWNLWLFRVIVMVFSVPFNNMSVISWQSALLVEETGVPGEIHRLAASHWQTLLDNTVLSTHRHERDSNSQHNWCTGTDCTGSCKSNYHTITTTSLFIEYVGHKLFTSQSYWLYLLNI